MKIKIKSDFTNATPVDVLAHNILNFYIETLKKFNFRLFAKRVNFELKKVDEYELLAFKSFFKDYFKTERQFRKTLHIKSDFFKFELPDYYDNYYTCFFTINKKEYKEKGQSYLDSIYNDIAFEIRNKTGIYD